MNILEECEDLTCDVENNLKDYSVTDTKISTKFDFNTVLYIIKNKLDGTIIDDLGVPVLFESEDEALEAMEFNAEYYGAKSEDYEVQKVKLISI